MRKIKGKNSNENFKKKKKEKGDKEGFANISNVSLV